MPSCHHALVSRYIVPSMLQWMVRFHSGRVLEVRPYSIDVRQLRFDVMLAIAPVTR